MTQPTGQAGKALVDLFSAFNRAGSLVGFHGLAGDATWQSDSFSAPPSTAAEIEAQVDRFRVAFPDLKFTLRGAMVEDASGSIVSAEFVMEGTNDGELEGVGTTHRRMELSGLAIAQVDGSTVTRLATYWNWAHGLGQLGVRAHARPGVLP